MKYDGWTIVQLGQVATLQRGFDLPEQARQKGAVPIISSCGVTGSHSEAKVHAPGVVTGRYGSVGDVFFVEEDFWPLNTTLWVKDFHGNNEKFVFQLLKTIDFKRYSAKTGVPGVNRNDLHKISVFRPPLTDQTWIVSILAGWERTSSKTIRIIESKQRFKQGLMRQLLSGNRRFPEFVRTRETRSTRYGHYPADWGYPRVSAVSTEVSERSRSENRYTVLSCSKHQGLVDSLEYFGKRVFSSDTSNYKVVRRGQFAYATNHIEEGSIGLLTTHEAGLISPIYTVFETDPRKVYAPFLFRLFKTELYRHIFEVNTSSSVDRRGSLRWAQFATIHVPLPTLGEQRRIVEVLDTVDREIDLLKRQADALTRQKKALMQKLLTGQIRVKV